MSIEELIIKSKTQSEVIGSLLRVKKNTKFDIDKYESCKRFVDGFISDLEKIEKK